MVTAATLGFTALVGGGYSAVATIVTLVVNLAISALLGKILAPNAPKSGRDTKGVQNVIRSNVLPRRIIYGEAVTGGPYAVIETTGTDNALLKMVVVISTHPVDDIIGVFIDDQYVNIAGAGGATNTSSGTNDLSSAYVLDTGKYGTGEAAGLVKIIKNNGWGFADHQYVTDGTATEPANDRARGVLIDTDLTTPWTQASVTRDSGTGLYTDSGHKLTNCAHIFLSFEYNRDVWSGFPKIKFHVRGKRLYNPEQDPTNFTDEGADTGGTHVLADPDTYTWSEDWSLSILDYLLNKSYGLGAKITGTLVEIDWTEMIQSYVDSSALITNALPSPDTDDTARYTTNGVLETNSTPVSNIESLLTSGGGELVYAQGMYKLRPAIYRLPNSVNDIINEDMIVSSLSIRTHAPRSDVFNKAAGVFVDKGYDESIPLTNDNKPRFEPSDFGIVDPLDSSGLNPYEIIDDEEIIREFDYPFTTREFEAQRLARIQLERVRRGMSVSFEANLKVLKFSVGDTVYLEILSNSKYANESFFNRLGLDDAVQNRPDSPFSIYYKQFKILDMQYTPASTISVVMVEEAEEIYEWNAGDASPTPNALESEIIADDPTGEVLPPDWFVASPDLAIDEVVPTAAGASVTTLIQWNAVARGSLVNAVDQVHISFYTLEYGIVTNPSIVGEGRVDIWIPSGSKVSDHTQILQGPIALETLYKDGSEYDFRVRAVSYAGRRSVWTYYSTDIGSDYAPTIPPSAGAVTVAISSDYLAFTYNSSGSSPSPASATLTATPYGFGSPEYRFDTGGGTFGSWSATATATYTPQADNANMPEIVRVEAREGSSGTAGASDSQTVVGIQPGVDGTGANAFTIILSNEAHTLATTAGGTVDYTGSGAEIRVFDGTTELNSTSGTPGIGEFVVTVDTINPSASITPGSITASGTPAVIADHTSMTEDTVVITYAVEIYVDSSTTATIYKDQSLAKSVGGLDGVTVYLENTGDTVTILNTAGTDYILPISPQSQFKILDGPTDVTDTTGVTYSIIGAQPQGGLTGSISDTIGTKGQITITGAAPLWTTNYELFQFRATYNTINYDLYFGMSKILKGNSGIIWNISKQAEVIAAASDGTGYTLPAGVAAQVSLFDNGVDITDTTAVTYSVDSPDTKNGLTIAVNDSIGSKGQVTLSGASPSWTTDSESFDIRISYDGNDYIQTYNITKAIAGVAGTLGQSVRTVNMYNLNDSTVADTTGGTFASPISGTNSSDGWTLDVPSLTVDGHIVYVTTRTFTDDTLSPQDASWSATSIYAQRTDGLVGTTGQSVRTVNMYNLNDSTVQDPTGGTFASPISGTNVTDGWTLDVPGLASDGDIVYVTTRTFTDDTLSPQDASWSATSIYAQRTDHAPIYYIQPVNGTAILNSTPGSLELQARQIISGVDTAITSGTIKIYEPDDTDRGYNPTVTAAEIDSSIVMTLKVLAGTVYDTITLVDVLDGTPGSSALNVGRKMDRLDQWFIYSSGLILTDPPWSVQTVSGPMGDLGLELTDNTASADSMKSEVLNIDPSKKYRVSLWAKQTGDRNSIPFIQFYEADGTIIGLATSDATGWVNIGNVSHDWFNADFNASFTKHTYEFGGDAVATIPQSPVAASMSLAGSFVIDGTNSTTISLQDYHVVELSDDGIDAVVGSVTSDNGLAWVRDNDGGAWVPVGTTTALTAKFYRNGAEIAARTWTVTRTVGNLGAANTSNTGEATSASIVAGDGTPTITLKFTHTASGVSVEETVYAAQGGTKGTTGDPGADGNVGWGHDLVFTATDADTVSWTSGSIWDAGGTQYNIVAGNTGNMTTRSYIVLDSDTSTTVLQTRTIAGTGALGAVGLNRILVCVAENTTTEAFFQVFGGRGGLKIAADEIAANSIIANNIAASFYTGRNFTGGTFQTRTPNTSSPYPGTSRAVVQEADPQIAVYSNDGASGDVEIFGITDVSGTAEISISGDFLSGSLDTAQMYSSAGITDLRGRLGVIEPSSATGGIATLTSVPQTLATGSTDYELDVDIYNTNLVVNTFSVTIYDKDFLIDQNPTAFTAPTWDIDFFYSVGSPHSWTAVPGANDSITGTNSDIQDGPEYIHRMNLNATRQWTWTPTSPFAVDDPIYYMIRVGKTSGSSNDPKLTACIVSEAVAGGNVQSLIDLTDVNTSTPTNRFVLVADGVDFESRLLSAADITTGTLAVLRGGTGVTTKTGTGSVVLSASPVFTGNPTAPTPLTADNDTSIATTAWVKLQGYGASGGTVTSSGSPLNNEVAVFATATDINSDSTFTWDGTTMRAPAIDASTSLITPRHNTDSGDGNGFRFWGSGDQYRIVMSAQGNATYGGRIDATSDYNMYFSMTSGTNRGFVFQSALTEVFAINPDGVRSNQPITGPKLFLDEDTAADAEVTNHGQVWVRNNTPNNLYFTNDDGTDYPVGYGVYRKTSINVLDNANNSETIGIQHINGVWHKNNATVRTLTLETSGGTNFHVGASLSIYNRWTSGNMIVNDTVSQTLWYLDGTTAVDSVGGVTISPGGYATLIRESTGISVIMGAGVTV